jgi:hypothetical protein
MSELNLLAAELVAMTHERDQALATIARIAALCEDRDYIADGDMVPFSAIECVIEGVLL